MAKRTKEKNEQATAIVTAAAAKQTPPAPDATVGLKLAKPTSADLGHLASFAVESAQRYNQGLGTCWNGGVAAHARLMAYGLLEMQVPKERPEASKEAIEKHNRKVFDDIGAEVCADAPCRDRIQTLLNKSRRYNAPCPRLMVSKKGMELLEKLGLVTPEIMKAHAKSSGACGGW